MARIKGTESKPLPADKAAKASPPTNGPHKPGTKAKTEANSDDPAYVVSVSKREATDEEKSYKPSPAAQREKARALLMSDKLSPKEQHVLHEILDPPQDSKDET